MSNNKWNDIQTLKWYGDSIYEPVCGKNRFEQSEINELVQLNNDLKKVETINPKKWLRVKHYYKERASKIVDLKLKYYGLGLCVWDDDEDYGCVPHAWMVVKKTKKMEKHRIDPTTWA